MIAHYIGAKILNWYLAIKSALIYCYQIITVACTTPFKWRQFIQYLYQIGVESVLVIMLTGFFSGMVLGLQSFLAFTRIGGQQLVGPFVAQGIVRELGPVLTGLMVTARAGSAITAELSAMRISEQIDALVTLRINPLQFLIVPRVAASIIALPCLTLFCMSCGILGGYVVCTLLLGLNPEEFVSGIIIFGDLPDVMSGLIKSMVFGFVMALSCTFYGYNARGGARGIGLATTQAVVVSSILILLSNYIVTKLIEQL